MDRKNKRKNNVVMKGFKIDTEDMEVLKNSLRNFFKEHLNIEVKIKHAIKISRALFNQVTENRKQKLCTVTQYGRK